MSNIPESVRDVLLVFGDEEQQKRMRDVEKVRAREDAERARREAARGEAEALFEFARNLAASGLLVRTGPVCFFHRSEGRSSFRFYACPDGRVKWAASCAPFGGGSETCASPDELLAHRHPSNVHD